MGSRQMNALQQVVHTIHKQREIYLTGYVISPNDLVIRVTVNPRTLSELISCATPYVPVTDCTEDRKESILGEPFEVAKDMPDNVYYLDLIVYNRVQKQLKFTLQQDSDVSS